jgi:hypothetical protein
MEIKKKELSIPYNLIFDFKTSLTFFISSSENSTTPFIFFDSSVSGIEIFKESQR